MKDFPTGDGTHAPAVEEQRLNHWTTRKFPIVHLWIADNNRTLSFHSPALSPENIEGPFKPASHVLYHILIGDGVKHIINTQNQSMYKM